LGAADRVRLAVSGVTLSDLLDEEV
jgi:hypothetical protein